MPAGGWASSGLAAGGASHGGRRPQSLQLEWNSDEGIHVWPASDVSSGKSVLDPPRLIKQGDSHLSFLCPFFCSSSNT